MVVCSEEVFEGTAPDSQERELAALVVAKVYFHLGSLDEALRFSLSAVSLLEQEAGTEFVETIYSEDL